MISVALLGSRPLSRTCLELLHTHTDVSVEAVVTYPEDHDGWWDGSLAEMAKEFGYPVCEESELYDLDLDYLLSVLYYDVLEPELLAHPSEGGLNLHLAELPRYRGSNPFSHAILNAREDEYWQYGVTLHFMDEDVDAGDIVARRFTDITEDDTARALYQRAETLAADLFESMLPKIVSKEVQELRQPQSEFKGKRYFYRNDSLEGEAEVELDALCNSNRHLDVYDRIRALEFPPFDPAYTTIAGKKVYLTRTGYEELLL